ncbi:MAG: universal stress protein [Pseudomonadota bacterium]
MAIERILVIVDPTATEHPCIEKAARIAVGLGSPIELFICDVEPADREQRRRNLLEQLSDLAAPLRERGLIVSVEYQWHAPLERGITQHVIRTKPGLVVKDAHRHSALAQSPVTQTDLMLMSLIPVPLLLVRPKTWSAHPCVSIGADPCHPADRPETLDENLIVTGCLLANAMRGRVDIFHVLQTPPHLPGEPVPPLERTRAHGAAREDVERVAAGASSLTSAMPVSFVEGAVAPGVIAHTIERQTDILVLGAAARGQWPGSAASGTAARVLEGIECDLLVLKPEGFVSPLLVTEDI